jgi:hypothetical protein
MHTAPSRASPVVDVITTWAERWVRQDAARFNAAQASTRLQHRRRELDDVNRFLATQRDLRKPGAIVTTTHDLGEERRTSAPP